MPFALGSGAGGSGSTGDIEQQSTTIEPWFDELDARRVEGHLRPYRRGHIRDIFVNSAIDAALARSVWTVIQDAKRDTPLSDTAVLRPLDRLELCAFGGDMFPQTDTMMLQRYLCALHRRWVVERDVRDDARDVLHVVEVDAGERRERFNVHCRIPAMRQRYVLQIWRREWPAKGEGSGWWENWKSRPLCLE